MASIMLLRQTDSTLYKFTRAGEQGKFSFSNLQPGKYVVFISCPKFVDYSDTIVLTPESKIDLGGIAMLPKAKILEMAVVKQKIAAMRWKGDTLVIKADSIKVADDANVEDLLKRIPGFQVDKNGNIKAMGEKVEKVLVDGEEFFGDDPTIATRGLDARAVNEVELFDKKSDQATFSGVDDGSKIKTINLKLKEDRKKGYFGKLEGATNGKELWDNNGMLNSFVGKRKISAYGIMSKTGKTGLGWGENMNYGNTGNMENWMDGDNFSRNFNNNDDEDNWDGRFSGNGIPKSWSAGINYNNKWNNDKQTFSGNYKFGKISTPAGSSTRSQYILPDTLYYINSSNQNFSSSTSQKVNIYSTLKIDSMNTMRITASAGRTNSLSTSNRYKESLNEELGFVNTNRTISNNSGDANSVFSTLFFSHNFKKLRRNLSVNTSFNNNAQQSEGFLYAVTDFYSGGLPSFSDTLDQKKTRDITKTEFRTGIAWTEPLSKIATLQVNYIFMAARSHSIKNAFDKSGGKYEDLNVLNSSDFRLLENTNTVGLTYSAKFKKLFVSAGNNFIFSNQNRQDLKLNTSTKFSFTNINPRLNLRYNPDKTTNMNLWASGFTQQPTPDQLQPLQENNDPLNILIGNPALKPSFSAYANLWFNRYDPETENYMQLSVNSSNTWNAIIGREEFDAQGRRVSQYINQPGGNYRYNVNGEYGYKISKTPFSISLQAGHSLNAFTNYINGLKNESKAKTYTLTPGISVRAMDKLYINTNYEMGWNKSSSNINTSARPEYRTDNARFDVYYNEPKKFTIRTDINYFFREKTSPNDANNEITTWNASFSWKLKLGAKEKNWTLGLEVYDILNQNNGFKRDITATGITESENEVLKRYFLVRLSWKFAKNGKPAWEE